MIVSKKEVPDVMLKHIWKFFIKKQWFRDFHKPQIDHLSVAGRSHGSLLKLVHLFEKHKKSYVIT